MNNARFVRLTRVGLGLGVLSLGLTGCYERVVEARGIGSRGTSTHRASSDPAGDAIFGKQARPRSASPGLRPWGDGEGISRPSVGPRQRAVARPSNREQ